ncbi:oxidoreductase [Corynebacterium choanae]|uniref:Phenol hydroxylase P5 protein n=1 Tax=Corynebacterium choanae TaxID=1862358 RepID=A0A3G6J6T5_9CORY|nr:oxidoreductase [Corynebacterium choanae]AZA12638.1 Phenol hydroxylase P5 protein [Corynebacterium choanae]
MKAHKLGFVAARVSAHAEPLRAEITEAYIRRCPEDRLLLPVRTQAMFTHLPEMLAWLLSATPTSGEIPTDILQIVADFGCQIRLLGIDPDHYPILGECVSAAVANHCQGIPGGYITQATTVIAAAFAQAAAAARAEAAAGYAAGATATVVETVRRCRRITVVRAIVDRPWTWEPGQYVAVTANRIQGHFRYLSPALPANPAGEIEFHIKADSPLSVTGRLAGITAGEQLTISRAYGTVVYDDTDTSDRLFIAHTTGLAPIKAQLIAMATQGAAGRRAHLFFGADYPGELYDLRGLWQLAASNPWLAVTPVALHETDEFWVKPTLDCTAPRGLHLMQHGEIGDIVSSYGTWEDRTITVCASPENTDKIVTALIDGGTPAGNIFTDQG